MLKMQSLNVIRSSLITPQQNNHHKEIKEFPSKIISWTKTSIKMESELTLNLTSKTITWHQKFLEIFKR